MRPINILILIVCCSVLQSFSTSLNTNAKGDYYLVFCAVDPLNESFAGHAFVAIGKGTPFTCSAADGTTECWGMYATKDYECVPSRYQALISVVGEVPGCIYSDVGTKVNFHGVMRITFDEYLMVLGEIEKWKKKNYQLMESDCVSFVRSVASLFSPKITLPSDNMTNKLPINFVKALIDANKTLFDK